MVHCIPFTFQYLVYEGNPGTELRWVPNGQPRIIPQGSVLGGHDEDGTPFYIIRANHRVGWYDPRETQAVYAAHSRYLHSSQWEFLVMRYCEYDLTENIQDYIGFDWVPSLSWIVYNQRQIRGIIAFGIGKLRFSCAFTLNEIAAYSKVQCIYREVSTRFPFIVIRYRSISPIAFCITLLALGAIVFSH